MEVNWKLLYSGTGILAVREAITRTIQKNIQSGYHSDSHLAVNSINGKIIFLKKLVPWKISEYYHLSLMALKLNIVMG